MTRQTLEVACQFGDVGGEDNGSTASAAVGMRDLDAIDVCFGDGRVSAEDVGNLSSKLLGAFDVGHAILTSFVLTFSLRHLKVSPRRSTKYNLPSASSIIISPERNHRSPFLKTSVTILFLVAAGFW